MDDVSVLAVVDVLVAVEVSDAELVLVPLDEVVAAGGGGGGGGIWPMVWDDPLVEPDDADPLPSLDGGGGGIWPALCVSMDSSEASIFWKSVDDVSLASLAPVESVESDVVVSAVAVVLAEAVALVPSDDALLVLGGGPGGGGGGGAAPCGPAPEPPCAELSVPFDALSWAMKAAKAAPACMEAPDASTVGVVPVLDPDVDADVASVDAEESAVEDDADSDLRYWRSCCWLETLPREKDIPHLIVGISPTKTRQA